MPPSSPTIFSQSSCGDLVTPWKGAARGLLGILADHVHALEDALDQAGNDLRDGRGKKSLRTAQTSATR